MSHPDPRYEDGDPVSIVGPEVETQPQDDLELFEAEELKEDDADSYKDNLENR